MEKKNNSTMRFQIALAFARGIHHGFILSSKVLLELGVLVGHRSPSESPGPQKDIYKIPTKKTEINNVIN